MKIGERYAVARRTTNLRSDVRTVFSSSDVLGAAGLAAQKFDAWGQPKKDTTDEVAMLLFDVVYKAKTSSIIALREMLGRDLLGFMYRAKLDGDPRVIAEQVIAYWLEGNNCKPCKGRGYELVPGTPALSGRVCKACKGTRKEKDLPDSEAHYWLHDRMSRLAAIAGGKVMRKIADDLKDF